jgi:inward rectifier potassium channel
MIAANVGFVVVVSGYDEVDTQTVHARKAYEHHRIKHGHRYADIMRSLGDGRLKVEYGRFHEPFKTRLSHSRHADFRCKLCRQRDKICSD